MTTIINLGSRDRWVVEEVHLGKGQANLERNELKTSSTMTNLSLIILDKIICQVFTMVPGKLELMMID